MLAAEARHAVGPERAVFDPQQDRLGVVPIDVDFGVVDAPRDAVIHAQEFVFVLSVMAVGLATLLSHVRSTQAELEAANDELRRRVIAGQRRRLEDFGPARLRQDLDHLLARVH